MRRELWDQAPAKYGFGRAGLWRLGGDEALRRIARMLEDDAASLPAGIDHVEGAELWIDAALPLDPMRIGSQIDRLDAGPGIAVVVDYKSGKAIDRRDVEAGRRLQLQLYAHLARARTGAERVIARYAFLRPPAKPWDLDTARPEDAALVDQAVELAAEARAGVEAGQFRVAPWDGCPRWCPLQHACRKNESTRWKHWD